MERQAYKTAVAEILHKASRELGTVRDTVEQNGASSIGNSDITVFVAGMMRLLDMQAKQIERKV